jgi:hypothetical protein
MKSKSSIVESLFAALNLLCRTHLHRRNERFEGRIMAVLVELALHKGLLASGMGPLKLPWEKTKATVEIPSRARTDTLSLSTT